MFILQWHTRELKQCKIFEISLTKSQILKKLQTLAIIWENSDSNLETRQNGSKLGVSWIIRESWQHCWCCNLSNDDMKADVKNDICWSKIGSEPGGTSPPRIPRSIPLGLVVSITNCFQRELTLCWIIQWETTVTLTCCFKHETQLLTNYHQILKISPWAYIFQRPFLRGLVLEGLIYGRKFAFQNWLGWPYSWR